MSRTLSEKVGRGACPCCGEPVTYRRSSGGFLTHKCEACDSTGYAEPGGKAYADRMKSIKSETAPADKIEPKADTQPPEPKKRAAFSLESLT